MLRGVGYWLVHPDGSGLHLADPLGAWAAWSGDSKWLYYSESSPVQDTGSFRLMKIPAEGGTPVLVRYRQRARPGAGARRFRVVLHGPLAESERLAGLRTARGPSRERPFEVAGPHLRPASAACGRACIR